MNCNYNQGWSQEWDDMKRYGPVSRHVRRLVKILLADLSFRSVLDVGCGQGSLLAEIEEIRPNVELFGTDSSEAGLALAGKAVPTASFYEMDITKTDLGRSFDLVLCIDVLEHIVEDKLAVANLVKMTGRYLLVKSIQGRMRSYEPAAVGHIRNYKRNELKQMLLDHKLRILKEINWGFPFFSPLYRDFLSLGGHHATTGEFGPARKLAAYLLYYLFFFNSTKLGDEVYVLAEKI